MNKKDVLEILEVVASDVFFKDFKIRKSDNSIICKTDYGYKRVSFNYFNTYDLLRDDLALEMKPFYEIRFNVLHKWFEKYSKRQLQFQRDDSSMAFWGDKLCTTNEFFFLENRKGYKKDLQTLYTEVVKNAEYVFSNFNSIKCYYSYFIESILNGKRELPNDGFDWVVEYLIATKIVEPANYDFVKKLILKRVEFMMSRKEPNTALYYNDIPMILEDLESTDFSSGKWGKLPL